MVRGNVTEVIVRAMKSPRSALCKTSIMASADIFHCFGHLLLFTTEKNSFGQLVISYSLRWHFYSLLKHITFANIVCKWWRLSDQLNAFPPPKSLKFVKWLGDRSFKLWDLCPELKSWFKLHANFLPKTSLMLILITSDRHFDCNDLLKTFGAAAC